MRGRNYTFPDRRLPKLEYLNEIMRIGRETMNVNGTPVHDVHKLSAEAFARRLGLSIRVKSTGVAGFDCWICRAHYIKIGFDPQDTSILPCIGSIHKDYYDALEEISPSPRLEVMSDKERKLRDAAIRGILIDVG